MALQLPLVWIYFAVGAAAAVLLSGLIFWGIFSDRRRRWLEASEALKQLLEQSRDERETLRRELEEERNITAALEARIEELRNLREERNREASRERERLEGQLRERSERITVLEKALSEARTRLEEERRQSERSLRELKEARESMQKEFKVLAAQIMEENSRRFGAISGERVGAILKPLQQQVESFRKRVDEVHGEEGREMAALLNEIKSLKELNRQISDDAVKLTRALRGESKTQGIWGEMVLERVLEASGLRKGEEYEREVSLRDDERRRFRPDVIVHLPGDRDIVIDAKTSLTAYEQYVNAEDKDRRALYARKHLASVQEHIDRLSDKSYTRLEGINTLDFIFMFLPIEGALMLALREDPQLYDKAFGRHIVLVSPTTLLVALRAVENTWRHERQNRNALKIAERAGALYDKFVSFATDMERLGKQIDTVQKSYDAAWNKLGAGRGNIVRQIENIRELGARASKQMPRSLLEESAGAEDSALPPPSHSPENGDPIPEKKKGNP